MRTKSLGILRVIFGMLLSFALLQGLSAKNYYISATGDDSNDGSISAPWSSIGKVSAALASDKNGGFIQPGDSILFRSGDVFIGRMICYRSGEEGNAIVFGRYGQGEKPVLTASGSPLGTDYIEVIKLISASYITIDGLWIKNDRKNMGDITWGTNASQGIKIEAKVWGGIVKGLVFRNLKITDVFGIDMKDYQGNYTDGVASHGIWLDAEKDDLSSSPPKKVGIEDILIENCEFYNIGNRGVSVRKLGNVRNNPIHEEERIKNIVVRNNTFERLGGDGVVLASVCYALIENNDFIDLGWGDRDSFTDRYQARGEGCWIWDTRFMVFQNNRQIRANGKGDTYASHIDFFCQHIIFQYNYSEDTEGGFCEILGDCKNLTWRYNVSVNDGFRETGHNRYSIWLSGYVGADQTPIPSDSNFIYNNTIYLDKSSCKPDISVFAKNTYIYNNIFHATGGAQIGAGEVEIDIQDGSEFQVSNNLFYGDVANDFTKLDGNKVLGQASFVNPQSSNGNMDGYNIQEESPAIDAGKAFPELEFPMAGKGIFKNVSNKTSEDAYGNSVDLGAVIPNIGASNAYNGNIPVSIKLQEEPINAFRIISNPVRDVLRLTLEDATRYSELNIYSIKGEIIYSGLIFNAEKEQQVQIPEGVKNGIYIVSIRQGENLQHAQFVLYR